MLRFSTWKCDNFKCPILTLGVPAKFQVYIFVNFLGSVYDFVSFLNNWFSWRKFSLVILERLETFPLAVCQIFNNKCFNNDSKFTSQFLLDNPGEKIKQSKQYIIKLLLKFIPLIIANITFFLENRGKWIRVKMGSVGP